MSRGWLKAIAETPSLRDRITVVGLNDIDPAAAHRLATEFGLTHAAVEPDLDALLSGTRPDLVFDVVIPKARHDVVATALRHGCHVLSEKPMATSLEEGRDLIEKARAAGKVHAIVQNRRFNQGVRRIHETLRSGALGTLNAIHCDFFVGAHFGGFREQMEHVLLVDMAIHTLDAARFMSGKTPLAVYCHESNPKSSWYAKDSVANAIFEFSDDVIFTYRGSWSAEGANTSWDSNWRIVGSRGTLLWDGENAFSAKVVAGNEGFFRPLEAIEVSQPADAAQVHGHASVLLDFLDSIEAGRPPETVTTDNINSLAMVFAAIESARTRQRVIISV
jgi:predicted dehydrogenase